MALKRPAVNATVETNQAAEVVADVKDTTVVSEQTQDVREEQVAEASNEQVVEDQVEEEAQDVQPEQEVHQAAETSHLEVEQVQAKEVAVVQQGGAVAVATPAAAVRGAMAQYTQEMAEMGFEGLTVDGMSFDRVKLAEGKFVMGTEEVSLGESFDIQLMSTRPIFVVRREDSDQSPLYFSYDPNGETLTDGSSAASIKEEWLEDGYGTPDQPLDIKRYLEGMAQLINRDDEWNGHMVSLSIPPASTSRLGGATATGYQRWKRDPSGLVIRCKVGQKVSKGSISWRPWVFIAVGPYDAE